MIQWERESSEYVGVKAIVGAEYSKLCIIAGRGEESVSQSDDAAGFDP